MWPDRISITDELLNLINDPPVLRFKRFLPHRTENATDMKQFDSKPRDGTLSRSRTSRGGEATEAKKEKMNKKKEEEEHG